MSIFNNSINDFECDDLTVYKSVKLNGINNSTTNQLYLTLSPNNEVQKQTINLDDYITNEELNDALLNYYTIPFINSFFLNKIEASTTYATLDNLNQNYSTTTQINNSFYNKAYIDAFYYQKSSLYTKTYIDTFFYNKNLLYTKAETDNKLVSEYYDKTYIDTNVYYKNLVYTKTEIDTKLNDYYNKTTIDNKFNDYYNKTDADNRYIIKNQQTTTFNNIIVNGDITITGKLTKNPDFWQIRYSGNDWELFNYTQWQTIRFNQLTRQQSDTFSINIIDVVINNPYYDPPVDNLRYIGPNSRWYSIRANFFVYTDTYLPDTMKFYMYINEQSAYYLGRTNREQKQAYFEILTDLLQNNGTFSFRVQVPSISGDNTVHGLSGYTVSFFPLS